MTLDPKKVAERLGAAHIGQVPDTGGGAFGMARLAAVLKERLHGHGGQRQGAGVAWVLTSKVPMSAETERLLIALAEKLSASGRFVDPLHLAAQLLEETVQKLAKEQHE